MTLVLPYPNQPTNGNSLDATPVNSNTTAIAQAIQSFDASQIQAGTLLASAFVASINPNTLLHDTISAFVPSGCVWSTVSGLSGTMTSGVIYVGNSTSTFRTIIGGVGSFTFTASKDTYIDIDYNGNITYSAVANGAAAPALTANSVRVAKVITNGSAITSIVQSGYDSLFNPILPKAAAGLTGLFNTVQSYTNPGTAGGTGYYINLGGIKLLWGITGVISLSTQSAVAYTITFPNSFFNSIQSCIVTNSGGQAVSNQFISVSSNSPVTPTGVNFYLVSDTATNTNASTSASFFVIGA